MTQQGREELTRQMRQRALSDDTEHGLAEWYLLATGWTKATGIEGCASVDDAWVHPENIPGTRINQREPLATWQAVSMQVHCNRRRILWLLARRGINGHRCRPAWQGWTERGKPEEL